MSAVPSAKVLLVDDDPVILKLLEVNFEMEGFEVTTAADGPFNVIEPGKRPRVTLTPTLALRGLPTAQPCPECGQLARGGTDAPRPIGKAAR